MLFINWLLSLISAVTAEDLVKFAPVSSEDGKEIKALRPLDEDEKKLYAVLSKLSEERNNLGKEHEKMHEDENYDNSACEEFHKKMEDLEGKTKLISRIMWKSIQMTLQNEGPKHLRITADWQLAEIIGEDSHGMIISIGGEDGLPLSALFGGNGGLSILDMIMAAK